MTSDKRKNGRSLFNEIKKHHHHRPPEECTMWCQAEAMAHVAAALNEQNDLLRGMEEQLQTIEKNTRRV